MGIVLIFMLLVVQCRAQGSWELLIQNAGIASMHTVVTRFGNVVLLDRTNIGPSQLPLPTGICRDNPQDLRSKHDCTAHSALLDPVSRSIRPLFIFTDTWCSSGQVDPNGTLIQTGGDRDGFTKIRSFNPCQSNGSCDWIESSSQSLQSGRWYATNQLLPDGTQIVVGGRGEVTLEYVPPNGKGTIYLELLAKAYDAQGDTLYPFVHLLPDGNLFIFANTQSILYNYTSDSVIKKFPDLPGNPRNYPSAGSSVLLPLNYSDVFSNAEVMVCGGAKYGASLNTSLYLPASMSCGRMMLTDSNPQWKLEQMPIRRTMGDMVLLPNGEVLIINGARNGCQGWGAAKTPALAPVVYNPNQHSFMKQAPSSIPRVYHSTANLLPDGRVLVAGSNTHEVYTFTGDFPTELRIEAFSPQYLNLAFDAFRPKIAWWSNPNKVSYGSMFTLTITIQSPLNQDVEVSLVNAPFTTHSYSQGQRLLKLQVRKQRNLGWAYRIEVIAPPNPNVAPRGYYMLFVTYEGVPSTAIWVQVSH